MSTTRSPCGQDLMTASVDPRRSLPEAKDSGEGRVFRGAGPLQIPFPLSRSARVRWALAALLLLYLVLAIGSLRGDSVTVDEFGHLPVGYNLLRTGDFDLCELNPPLMNVLSALPVLLGGVRESGTGAAFAPEDRAGFWANGYDFMARFPSDYQRVFVSARLVTVVLVGLLGLLLFGWAHRLVPRRAADTAGLLAAALLWLSPSVLAQARLVSTDAGAACFIALAFFTVHCYLEKPGAGRAALAGVALGAAQLVKFHALVLYPVVGLLLLFEQPRSAGLSPGVPHRDDAGDASGVEQRRSSEDAASRGAGLRRRLVYGGVILAVSVLVVNAGYLFHGSFAPAESFVLRSGPMKALGTIIPGWAPVPLPRMFVVALDQQLADAAAGDPSYLMGESYVGGRWYYFLALLAVKEPLPELLLALAALAFGLRRKLFAQLRTRLLLLPATVLLVAFSFLSHKQLGLRMILPAVPLFTLWAATVLAELPERAFWQRRRVWSGALAAVLAGWTLVEPLRAFPHYLAYFNPIAGGASGGHRYGLDSSLDWGQDLIRLKRFLDSEAVDSIQLLYFGRAAPEVYGIRYTVPTRGLRPGLVAVSATLLGRPYFLYDHGTLLAMPGPLLVGRDVVGDRVGTVGRTLYLYRVAAGQPGELTLRPVARIPLAPR